MNWWTKRRFSVAHFVGYFIGSQLGRLLSEVAIK